MTLKTALVSTALALSASLAAAGPVSYEFSDQLDSGPFSRTYGFSLGTGASFSGMLKTTISTVDNLSISSLVLSNGSTQYQFDMLNDGFDFDAVDHSTTTTTVKGHTIYTFVDSYAWDPVFLSAGDWTVTVTGSNVSDKQGGRLNLLLVDPPASVPEPGSLALALAALAGVGFASRRRAA